MRPVRLVFVLVTTLGLAAAAPSPEAAWKTAIAGTNRDYAQIPHAMLKIQDAAYLGEGQIAVLTGIKGKPGSWRWSHDLDAQGPLRVGVLKGQLHVAVNGKPVDPALVRKSIAVDADVDVAGQPTQVGAGVNGWRIFVYNQKNPVALAFKGVAYFPYDAKFRLNARFIADVKLPPRVFRTSRGTDKQFFHAGDAHFALAGKDIVLPFFTDDHDAKAVKEMSAFYTDEMSGAGAYPTGRYVDAEPFGKFPPSSITIDFNNAYNPNCARSAFFTCPVATDHIAVKMTAGERDPHSLH
jgi:uncharacterized protein (DUF1684 family)